MTATAGMLGEATPDVGARPTALLPIPQLVRISLYWLGLTAIDAAVGLFITNRLEFDHFVPQENVGTTLFLVGIGGSIVGIIVQPTVGYISDFTVSRWGRRKPYIVFGSLLDVVFLLGIATSNTVLALAAFVILLSFSTNIARGPFQGYVPDLVAEPQVGLASGLVGMMQIVGNVTGYVLVSLSVAYGPDGRSACSRSRSSSSSRCSASSCASARGLPPRPREGRSWPRIAREAWATDILQERSFVWLLVSRLLFLTGGALLANFVVIYMSRTFGMSKGEANDTNVAILHRGRARERHGDLPGIAAVGPAGAQAADLGGVRDRRRRDRDRRARAVGPGRASSAPRCSGRRAGCSSPSTGR